MDLLLITPRQSLHEHAGRLKRSEVARRTSEIQRRMRIRNLLRKAILESAKLDGETRELAVELHALALRAERRLSGRPCC